MFKELNNNSDNVNDDVDKFNLFKPAGHVMHQ